MTVPTIFGGMSPTLTALVGYALWTLALALTIGLLRAALVMRGARAANDFSPTGEDVGGFSRRLARAHANCYENLPAVAAILIAALLSGEGALSDTYALWILYARLAQSAVHLATNSVIGVNVRFVFYLAQLALLAIIAVGLF